MSETIEVPRPFVGLYRTGGDDLTVLEIHGPATTESVVSLTTQLAASPTPRLLWDLRACSLRHLGGDDLHWMLRQLIQLQGLSRQPVAARSAFVCSSEPDAIVLHRLITYADTNGDGVKLALFRDFDVARRWLADA